MANSNSFNELFQCFNCKIVTQLMNCSNVFYGKKVTQLMNGSNVLMAKSNSVNELLFQCFNGKK